MLTPFCQEYFSMHCHILLSRCVLVPSAQGIPQGNGFLFAEVFIFQPSFDDPNDFPVLHCSLSADLDYQVKLLASLMAPCDVTSLWVPGFSDPELVPFSSGRGGFLFGRFFENFCQVLLLFCIVLFLFLFLFHCLSLPRPIASCRCACWLDSSQDLSALEPSLLLRKLGWARPFAKAGGISCEDAA